MDEDILDRLETQHRELVRREFPEAYDRLQLNDLRAKGIICQVCENKARPGDIFCSEACETLARR